MFKVKLIGCDPQRREIEISTEGLPIVIGRAPEADIQIDDRWTSRQHCRLSAVDGVLWAADLNSTHGTYVNGCDAHEAPLAEGDTLQVGLSAFRVTYERAEVASRE